MQNRAMVKYYSPLVWGVVALVVGLSLVIWQDAVLKLAVFFMGLVVTTVAVVGLISYFTARGKNPNRRGAIMPVGLFLMLLWGVVMLAQPKVFVDISMVLLGIAIAFMAVNQIVGLNSYRRSGIPVKGRYYIFPILLLLAGGLSIWNPEFIASWIVIFMGCWIGFYGLSEILDYFFLKQLAKDQQKNYE